MVKCMKAAERHGGLKRYRGGFWSARGVDLKDCDPGDPPAPVWWYGWGTIQALCNRGILEVTLMGNGKWGKFPIEVKIKVDAEKNP